MLIQFGISRQRLSTLVPLSSPRELSGPCLSEWKDAGLIRCQGSGFGGQEMSVKYTVIFERAEHNWSAYVPDLPGCISTGKTLEAAENNIREAIAGHLQVLREVGEPVPKPVSVAKDVEVTTAA